MCFKQPYCKKAVAIIGIFSVYMFLSFTALSKSDRYGPIPVRGMPTILDLGATACVPCKMMAPILEKLKEDYKGRAAVIFIDVWKDPVPARKFGIRTIPTQIFFDKNGAEVTRHEGFLDEASIVRMLDHLGATAELSLTKPVEAKPVQSENWFSADPLFTAVTGVGVVFLIVSGWFVIRSKKARRNV